MKKCYICGKAKPFNHGTWKSIYKANKDGIYLEWMCYECVPEGREV